MIPVIGEIITVGMVFLRGLWDGILQFSQWLMGTFRFDNPKHLFSLAILFIIFTMGLLLVFGGSGIAGSSSGSGEGVIKASNFISLKGLNVFGGCVKGTSGDIDCDGIPDGEDSDMDGDGLANNIDNDRDGDGLVDNVNDPNPDGGSEIGDEEYVSDPYNHCFNGLQDVFADDDPTFTLSQRETGVDCGGSDCRACDCTEYGVEYDSLICPVVFVYDSEGTVKKGSYGYCCERTNAFEPGWANYCLTKIPYADVSTTDRDIIFNPAITTAVFSRDSANNGCDSGWILNKSLTAPVLIEPSDNLSVTDNYTRMGWV